GLHGADCLRRRASRRPCGRASRRGERRAAAAGARWAGGRLSLTILCRPVLTNARYPRYIDRMIRGILAILLLTGFLLAGSAAHARQDDPRLDELLSQLAKAESAEEAKLLEQEIWRIWLTSGSDTVDFLMVQGMSYMEHGDLDRKSTRLTSS